MGIRPHTFSNSPSVRNVGNWAKPEAISVSFRFVKNSLSLSYESQVQRDC